MARDPADRYGTPLELARDIDAYLADSPVTAYREPPLRRLARWARRHRTMAQIGVAALALLLLFAAGMNFILRRAAHEQYLARQTALKLAANLAASTAALQIESRWRVLEYEADNNRLVTALREAEDRPFDPAAGRRQWSGIQSALDDIASRTRDVIRADAWSVCDATGRQVARSPQADTIGQNFAYRDYFHGGDRDLAPGTTAEPLTEVHRSTVYRSTTTGRLHVAFSAPVWSDDVGAAGRHVLGVILISFDVGTMFRSIDAIGAWNASESPFSVAVIDLRDDEVEGEPRSGLVLENPDMDTADVAGSADLQLVRVPADVVTRLKGSFHRHAASGGHPHHPDQSGPADAEILGLFPGTLQQLFGSEGSQAGIAAAEPIRILGRPPRLADVGWAVLVHER